MKKLINDPRHVVREMLEGLADLQPGLALLRDENVVLRSDLPGVADRKVAVISGGGSGHEPAHAGYVGPGLLTAAVAGDVFTSPSVDAVLAAIRASAGPTGAVLIVKNYTGDRLNFGLAAELAAGEGIPTEVVVVADDVALRDLVEPSRRRGIAGTVLVHKIAGAAAEAGRPVTEVAAFARAAAAELGTMGVALGSCIVPTAGKAGFALGEDEIELGLGIHGEKGVARGAMRPADAIVDVIVSAIVEDRGLRQGDRVALLVNGLGATPPMELAIVARRALERLRASGIEVLRAWQGNFLTALEMPGCSISTLRLDDARLNALDAPASAPAWPGGGHVGAARLIVEVSDAGESSGAGAAVAGPLSARLREAAFSVAQALDEAEPLLTDLDSQAGDGDLGASMARGAAAIRSLPDAAWATPETAFSALGQALRRQIAGSSGPFYAAALLRAARQLSGQPEPDAASWGRALEAAIGAVTELGGARPGDRTMVDALAPALAALLAAGVEGHSAQGAWLAAVRAAEDGAEATAAMVPKLGRASYLGERAVGAPDGGAVAIAIWMRALVPHVR